MFDEALILAIGGLAVLVNRFVEGFITPIFDKFGLDKFAIMYIAWVLAGLLVFATGMNLFEELIQNQIIGQIVTAVVSGGGANLLHDLFDKE